jgi:MFS family permease
MTSQNAKEKSAQLVARLGRLPFSHWHKLHPTHLRATAVGWFFGIGRVGSFLAPTVIGFMLAYGAGDYVLYTFAFAYLIASFALLAIGIETKGRVLEHILQPKIA